jgi:FixJ family two-component response regulator
MWDVPQALAISQEQLRTLEAWIAARNTPQKVVFRSRIVLMAAEGKANRRIAQELQTSRPTVILWRQRFAPFGFDGFQHRRIIRPVLQPFFNLLSVEA